MQLTKTFQHPNLGNDMIYLDTKGIEGKEEWSGKLCWQLIYIFSQWISRDTGS